MRTQAQLQHGVIRAVGVRPSTIEELCVKLNAHGAEMRNVLWYLVFADRSVTCGADDRFRLGSPPEDWSRLQHVHP